MLNPPNWPKRMWMTCGDGCLSTVATVGDATGVYGADAKFQDGDIYVRTIMGNMEWKTDELISLSDGKALAVMRHSIDCYVSADAPFLFEFMGDPATSHWVHRYDPATQKLIGSADPITM